MHRSLLGAALVGVVCVAVGVSQVRAQAPSGSGSTAAPVPAKSTSGSAIKIVSPKENVASIRYALNEFPFTIEPGHVQDLANDREWVISFDRGFGKGMVEYTMSPGTYRFTMTDGGWEIYRDKEKDKDVAKVSTPAAVPPVATPSATAPKK